MSGKQYQYDPAEMFKEWIQKSGKAQSDFMKNMSSMQTKGMDKMFNFNPVMPNFLSWGSYKTTVGTNGRISIPEAERDALGLKEGDLVQVFVLPIEKKGKRR